MSRRGLRAQAALLATLALGVALVACGGDGDESEGGGISEADVEDAGMQFAECMREYGIEVQDPQPGPEGLRGMLQDADRDDPTFRDAERECQEHLEDLVAEIDDDRRRELEDARLEFSRCMRDKGYDVPDPQSGGGAGQGGGALGDLDLEDPRVQEAMDACGERISSLVPGE